MEYGVLKNKKGQGIAKYNIKDNTYKIHFEHANLYYGEPLFIPKPHSNNEDNGVVLSIVYNDVKNKNYNTNFRCRKI